MKKKSPRFFCQYCNTEVERNAKFCSTCGRIFVSVCCPQCGHTGSHDSFSSGCPACGYCEQSENNAKRKKNRGIDKKRSTYTNDALPLWVYGIIFLLFVLLAAGAFFYL